MTTFKRVASLKPQPSDNDNRVTVTFIGPDLVQREYTVNQRTLNRFANAAEAKAALDDWTFKTFGYVLNDVYFHKNRDGSWAVGTGTPPALWPEDTPEIP